jgi:hypothetical protein
MASGRSERANSVGRQSIAAAGSGYLTRSTWYLPIVSYSIDYPPPHHSVQIARVWLVPFARFPKEGSFPVTHSMNSRRWNDTHVGRRLGACNASRGLESHWPGRQVPVVKRRLIGMPATVRMNDLSPGVENCRMTVFIESRPPAVLRDLSCTVLKSSVASLAFNRIVHCPLFSIDDCQLFDHHTHAQSDRKVTVAARPT